MPSKIQQAWMAEYIKCFNATEAARRVGYKWPNKKGPELKKKFESEIQAYLDEKMMSADEVLIRLAEQARSSQADFANVQLREDLRDHPKAHLIKKITTDVHETATGKIYHKIQLELYDAQAALVHIGKVHGLFTDRYQVEHQVEPIQIIELVKPEDNDSSN